MNHDAMTYLLLTFGGCLGVYQMGAVMGGFQGLWFLRNARYSFAVGVMILAATYGWFFTCANLEMNANDGAVVEGHEQLVFFLLGAFLALVVTMLVSSLVNLHGVKTESPPVLGEGLEDLKTHTAFEAFRIRWRAWRGRP